MQSGWQGRLAPLAALGMVTACAAAGAAGGAEGPTVHVAVEAPFVPAPGEAPAGYVPMSVGEFMFEQDDEDQMILFQGERGSFSRPIASDAARFVRESREKKLSSKLRRKYEARALELLANGGSFLRAELSYPDKANAELRLLVKRADKVERVDAGDDAIPVILLQKIPIFVQSTLLKEVGGWVPPD